MSAFICTYVIYPAKIHKKKKIAPKTTSVNRPVKLWYI